MSEWWHGSFQLGKEIGLFKPMNILTRYIVYSVITATSLIVLALLGIESFIGLVAQLPDIGKEQYNLWMAIQYVLLFDPYILYQFFPIACLLGSLIGLGALASTHQLVAMRASGVSIAQIMLAVVKSALIMLIFAILIGEGIAPKWVDKAALLKKDALGQQGDEVAVQGAWLKQGNNFIHVDNLISNTQIQGVTQYQFSGDNVLKAVITSKQGILDGGSWQLEESTLTEFTAQQVTTKPMPNQSLTVKIKPNLVSLLNEAPGQESLNKLYQSYRYRRQTGLAYSSLELAFWQRVFQPLTVVVMICLGVPFVFGSLRDAAMGSRFLLGGMLGFGFYTLNQFVGRFSIAIDLPPILAAILPIIVFAVMGLLLLRRVER